MSAFRNEYASEIEKIQSLRDHLFLQAHLFKNEVKAELEDIDKKWNKAKSEFSIVRTAAEKSQQEISESATLFLKTFFSHFDKIKNSLSN